MKTRTITITLEPDRETGEYFAKLKTDVSLTTVQHAFNSLTRSSDGRIIKEKVSHTKAYYFKRGIKSVFNHIGWLINSLIDGLKHSKKTFKDYVDEWENNCD